MKHVDAEWHPGISMHRIRVGAGPMGLAAAVGAILVCVVGFPQARWFLLASLAAGLVAAAAFWLWHKRKPAEIKRLSILK